MASKFYLPFGADDEVLTVVMRGRTYTLTVRELRAHLRQQALDNLTQACRGGQPEKEAIKKFLDYMYGK